MTGDLRASPVIMPAQTTLLRAADMQAAMRLYKQGPMRGDHTLNAVPIPAEPWREAAVLIPLLSDENGLRVVFTLRTAHLHAHAGQVSFPGGGAEPHDSDAIATALRETEEEVGLNPSRVEVLGQLDPYVTVTGYRVTPVVGLVDVHQAPPAWLPDDFEVAEIFDVPMSHVLTPGVLRAEAISREGVIRKTYVCNWQDYYIWGATAGMLRNLVEAITP